MAFTLPLIGDLADLGLNDFQIGPGNARKIRGYVRTNLGAGDALIDTTNQVTLLGDTPITILSNGTWSVDLPDTSSTDLNVEANTLQYELVVEYTSTGSPAKRVYRSGWFALTEADLELVDDVPMAVFSSLDLDLPSVTPSWRSAFAAEMEALRAETEAARDGAVAIVGPVDATVEGLIKNTGGVGPLTSAALSATYAGVHARAIDVTRAPYSATGDGTTDDTAAVQAAIDDAAIQGRSIFIPGGTYAVTGLTLPAQGYVSVRGEGPAVSVLHNTHASNHTLVVAGTGGGGATPYAERFSIESLGFTAAAVNAGQAALSVTLARDFSISDLHALNYGVGFRIDSMWRCRWSSIVAYTCAIGWHVIDSAYAGSTPTSFANCSALSCTTYGVKIDADMDGMAWIGGDITGNGNGLIVTGATSRNLTFEGINFEGNITNDVILGDGTAGPSNVNFIGCRFWRPSTAGTLSVDYIRGSNVTFLGCYWNNYTKAVNNASTAGVVRLLACHVVTVTTFATLGSNTIATASAIVEGSGTGFTRLGDTTRFNQAQVLFAKGINAFGGANTIGGAADTVGFFGATPVTKRTGVTVDAAGIHAALVSLGLISA